MARSLARTQWTALIACASTKSRLALEVHVSLPTPKVFGGEVDTKVPCGGGVEQTVRYHRIPRVIAALRHPKQGFSAAPENPCPPDSFAAYISFSGTDCSRAPRRLLSADRGRE